MPKGPFRSRFRKLGLNLGVWHPSPSHNTQEGIYTFKQMEEIQPVTARDAGLQLDLHLGGETLVDEQEFRYKKEEIKRVARELDWVQELSSQLSGRRETVSSMLINERDIQRADVVLNNMVDSGEYYPPVLTRGLTDTLDGAHRLAVMDAFWGEETIYLWEWLE